AAVGRDHHAIGKADPLASAVFEGSVAHRPVGRLVLAPVGVELSGDLTGQLIGNASHRSPRVHRWACGHSTAVRRVSRAPPEGAALPVRLQRLIWGSQMWNAA